MISFILIFSVVRNIKPQYEISYSQENIDKWVPMYMSHKLKNVMLMNKVWNEGFEFWPWENIIYWKERPGSSEDLD